MKEEKKEDSIVYVLVITMCTCLCIEPWIKGEAVSYIDIGTAAASSWQWR